MKVDRASAISIATVIFEKAKAIQKTHNTYHAADYLRRRGVSLKAALALLTGRKYNAPSSTPQTAYLVRPRLLAHSSSVGGHGGRS